MIEFLSDTEFNLADQNRYAKWVKMVIETEDKQCGDISYTFCSDDQLDVLNQKYLNHTDYTDIISFDSTIGSIISGEIFISIDRVKENAEKFQVPFEEELRRVMAHGILHYCGYGDKTEQESEIMRMKEEEKIRLFHVEQF